MESIFPVKYPLVWALFKEAQSYSWTAADDDVINLSREKEDYNSQPEKIQVFVRTSIAAAAGEWDLFRRITHSFFNEFQEVESRSFLGCQVRAEQNHYHVYCRLLETYLDINAGNNHIFKVIQDLRNDEMKPVEEIPLHLEKNGWLNEYDGDNTSLLARMACYASIKVIFGSTRSLAGLWFKKEKKLGGFSLWNGLISRELQLHLEFVGKMCELLTNRGLDINELLVKKIVESAVNLEKQFGDKLEFCEAFNVKDSLMVSHIEYWGNQVLLCMGCKIIYQTPTLEEILFKDVAYETREKMEESVLVKADRKEEEEE